MYAVTQWSGNLDECRSYSARTVEDTKGRLGGGRSRFQVGRRVGQAGPSDPRWAKGSPITCSAAGLAGVDRGGSFSGLVSAPLMGSRYDTEALKRMDGPRFSESQDTERYASQYRGMI